jgi:hypothetical protein
MEQQRIDIARRQNALDNAYRQETGARDQARINETIRHNKAMEDDDLEKRIADLKKLDAELKKEDSAYLDKVRERALEVFSNADNQGAWMAAISHISGMLMDRFGDKGEKYFASYGIPLDYNEEHKNNLIGILGQTEEEKLNEAKKTKEMEAEVQRESEKITREEKRAEAEAERVARGDVTKKQSLAMKWLTNDVDDDSMNILAKMLDLELENGTKLTEDQENKITAWAKKEVSGIGIDLGPQPAPPQPDPTVRPNIHGFPVPAETPPPAQAAPVGGLIPPGQTPTSAGVPANQMGMPPDNVMPMEEDERRILVEEKYKELVRQGHPNGAQTWALAERSI